LATRALGVRSTNGWSISHF